CDGWRRKARSFGVAASPAREHAAERCSSFDVAAVRDRDRRDARTRTSRTDAGVGGALPGLGVRPVTRPDAESVREVCWDPNAVCPGLRVGSAVVAGGDEEQHLL